MFVDKAKADSTSGSCICNEKTKKFRKRLKISKGSLISVCNVDQLWKTNFNDLMDQSIYNFPNISFNKHSRQQK